MYCASSDTDLNRSIATVPSLLVLMHVRSCVGPVNLKLDETLNPTACGADVLLKFSLSTTWVPPCER